MIVDLFLFNLLNAFVGSWFTVDLFFYLSAKVLPYLLVLPFLYLLFNDYKKNLYYVVRVFSAALFSRYVVCELIRYFAPRERPFLILENAKVISPLTESASFPSGHASFLFAISMVVFLYNKKIGSVFFALSTLVVVSRVYVGLHWPSDVFFGALIGLLCGFIAFNLFRK